MCDSSPHWPGNAWRLTRRCSAPGPPPAALARGGCCGGAAGAREAEGTRAGRARSGPRDRRVEPARVAPEGPEQTQGAGPPQRRPGTAASARRRALLAAPVAVAALGDAGRFKQEAEREAPWLSWWGPVPGPGDGWGDGWESPPCSFAEAEPQPGKWGRRPPGCEAAARQEDPPPACGPEPGPLQHSPSVRTLATHTHQHSHSHYHTDTCWSVPALPPPLLPPSPPGTVGVGEGAPGAPFSIAGARPRWSEAVPGSDTDGRHAAVCARRAPPR